LLPDLGRTALVWRDVASKNGIDLYLCRVESFAREDLASINFDASCEFPPNISGILPGDISKMSFVVDGFEGNLYDYPKLVELMLNQPDPAYRRFLSAMPSWDNTARMGKRASVFVNSSPELFRHWLTVITGRTVANLQGDEQIVFINAWNEWAEGCHLEPDRRYGDAYLEACMTALRATVDVELAPEVGGY
jgi:lipopolysaccharide biosynthesis protein